MIISFSEAKKLLLEGKNIAVPTETVYGLAGIVSIESALERIYSLKNRSKKNPMIIHVANLNQVKSLVKSISDDALMLMKKFWPGPLTLILPAKESVPSVARSDMPTIAIRMPQNDQVLKLIEEVGPIAAPSANLSGKPTATTIEAVEEDFGKNFPILEGSIPEVGLESTIIGQFPEWKLLRFGAIPIEEIEFMLQNKLSFSSEIACPGNFFKHYSPKAKLYRGKNTRDVQAIIGYNERTYDQSLPFFDLGSESNPREIAKNLFRIFRLIDAHNFEKVWIDDELPNQGLYLTIKERISRASEGESS